MSLYAEAAAAIENIENIGGSLKSRIYSNKNTKNQAAQIYALVIEATKWSPVLKEVIEKSQMLDYEKKVLLTSAMRTMELSSN
jgi:putative methyltransferase